MTSRAFDNRRQKVIGEALTIAAKFACENANQKTMAMFDSPNITRDNIIRKIANDYQRSEENLGEQGRRQSDGSNARSEAVEGRGQTDTQASERTGQQGSETSQVADNATANPALELSAFSPAGKAKWGIYQ